MNSYTLKLHYPNGICRIVPGFMSFNSCGKFIEHEGNLRAAGVLPAHIEIRYNMSKSGEKS